MQSYWKQEMTPRENSDAFSSYWIGRLPRLMQRTLLVTAVVVCNYAHKTVFSIQGCVFHLGNLIKWKIDTAKNCIKSSKSGMSVRYPFAQGGSIFIGAGYLRRGNDLDQDQWSVFWKDRLWLRPPSWCTCCFLPHHEVSIFASWQFPPIMLCFTLVPEMIEPRKTYLKPLKIWVKMSSYFWMVSQGLCHGDANLAHAQVALWQNGLQTESAWRGWKSHGMTQLGAVWY